MTNSTFSIIADVEKSIFYIYFSHGAMPKNNLIAILYYDINDVTTEEIFQFKSDLSGGLVNLCLTYKWVTECNWKTAPKYPIDELKNFAKTVNRDHKISNIIY